MPILNPDYSNIDYETVAASIGLKSNHIPIIFASFIEESNEMLSTLQEAVKLRDYNKIRSFSHAIKGSAGNLKFNEIYEMAKDMELNALEQKSGFDYEMYCKAIKEAIDTISI